MIGTMIAHYRITAKLGAGGMGEVYRATDTKLNREVAIKILPPHLAADIGFITRFQREAQVLASLNHPNIAAIYGVEERALIMELVEGDSPSGPLPPATALQYARQLVDALDYAHDRAIVHRDLKPANIKVTPEGNIKILDFGLAKIAEPERPPAAPKGDPSTSPTLTIRATEAGLIMGTASYMAPEQARAQHVDKRADIWSLGVVLHELLTGQPLFGGETISDTLAEVLKKDIDLSTLPAATPPELRALIARCLERDRRKRLRDMGEAWTSPPAAPAALAPPPAGRPMLAALCALLAVAFGVALWAPWRQPANRPALRLDIDPGEGEFGPPVLSRDGMRLVWDTPAGIRTRRLDESRNNLLAGTQGAVNPFLSPDGEWIGFVSHGKLRKIPFAGGAAVVLCDAPDSRGASWGSDGYIVAALAARENSVRIPENGGAPQPFGDRNLRWPQVLPDGKGVLATAPMGALLAAADGKSPKRLGADVAYARYLPGGYLVYTRRGLLYAAAFDSAAGRILPPEIQLADSVGRSTSGREQFDASPNALVFRQETLETVAAVDATGQVTSLVPKAANYRGAGLSPDGKRLVMGITDGGDLNTWIADLEKGVSSPLSPARVAANSLTWTPNGKFVVYNTGQFRLGWARTDLSGKTGQSRMVGTPDALNQDGTRLIFERSSPATLFDLYSVSVKTVGNDMELGPEGSEQPILVEPGNQRGADVSPDGRWLAYGSDHTGSFEVYVQAFPASGPLTGPRWQISSGGGRLLRWNRLAPELLYKSDSRIMVVPYRAEGQTFVAGKPRLWGSPNAPPIRGPADFDGKRVVFVQPHEGSGQRTFRVLLNLEDEIRRRIKAGK